MLSSAYLQSALLRLDGWANDITGLGTAALDKTVAALFARRATQYGDQYFADLYDEDALARRICDKVPDEMTRAGYTLRMGDAANAQQLSTDVADKLKRLDAVARIKDGMVWERVFGGTAVLIGADDGESDPSKPLNENKLQAITHLTVIDKPRIFARRWYPVTDPKAGQPETWTIVPLSGPEGNPQIEVHETRLLLFTGGRVTHQRRLELVGWGHGVLRACHDVLRDYNMSWQAITHMLQSANQDVWYMSGLKNALTGGTDAMREYFAARFSMAQMRMGPNRAVTLDSAGEKFERHSSTLTGVPETMQQVCLRLSASTDMPMTVLFGMSPAGLNATGASDLKIWNSAVAAMQIERLQPPLERLIRLILLSKNGPTKGKEPKGWSIKFNELAVLSDVEQAEVRNKQSDTDVKYVAAQVLLPEEVAQNRFRPEGWSAETTIDLDARQSILDAELERAVENAIEPPEPPPVVPAVVPAVVDPNAPPVVAPKPGDPIPPKPPEPGLGSP